MRSPVTAASSRRAEQGAVATRLTDATFRQLIESRDAQYGALVGVAFAEGIVVREPVQRSGLLRHVAMNIGMVCYASVGGSGVVATELAHALAVRGHHVHLISSEPPFRWRSGVPGMTFVPVEVPPYPLFREPQYLLALATTIARVGEEQRLDIVHAHYAVPHATAAYLADQMLATSQASGSSNARRARSRRCTGPTSRWSGAIPRYARVVAFSIERSHGVTAVSHSLKAGTIAALGIQHEIRRHPQLSRLRAVSAAARPGIARAALSRGRCEALVCTSRISGRSSAWISPSTCFA